MSPYNPFYWILPILLSLSFLGGTVYLYAKRKTPQFFPKVWWKILLLYIGVMILGAVIGLFLNGFLGIYRMKDIDVDSRAGGGNIPGTYANDDYKRDEDMYYYTDKDGKREPHKMRKALAFQAYVFKKLRDEARFTGKKINSECVSKVLFNDGQASTTNTQREIYDMYSQELLRCLEKAP